MGHRLIKYTYECGSNTRKETKESRWMLGNVVGSTWGKAPCDVKKEKKLAGWEGVGNCREGMVAKNE